MTSRLAYLVYSICHGCNDNAHGEKSHSDNLSARILLSAPYLPNKHSGDAPARTKDDMNRNRDSKVKGPVVQNANKPVDDGVASPTAERNLSGLEEPFTARGVLAAELYQRDEQELDECDEEAC